MSRLLEFEVLKNTRDLGGMPAADGRRVIPGRLIRSGQLAGLSASDSARISSLVGLVVDLRTYGEVAEDPDPRIPGVRYVHLPVVESFTEGVSREEESDRNLVSRLIFDPEGSKRYMCSMYRKFTGDFCVGQYARFIRMLTDSPQKAVLWHCSVGKDRAGIATVILCEILGVPREAVIEDYLSTTDYLRGFVEGERQSILNAVSAEKALSGAETKAISASVDYLFGTNRDYIGAYYEATDRKYGSYDKFIRDGLGLDDSDIGTLREKLLE